MSSNLLSLMKQFRMAYAQANQAELHAVTSDDFEWHQHYGLRSDAANDSPTGRILQGIDALVEELAWRQEHWQDVSYQNLEERVAGDDLLVQTFTIQGKEDGVPFHAKVVDLYPVVAGKIVRKDTYWKYLK